MVSLLRLVQRGFRAAWDPQPTRSSARHRFRPCLSELESRQLLTTILDMGALGNGDYSYAYGINNQGEVVGESGQVAGFPHAFLWDAEHGIQDLGTLNGVGGSNAYGINDHGQIVGVSDVNVTGVDTHAFLWDSQNGMHDLGTLGGMSSSAAGINNFGKVVGGSSTSPGGFEQHAFLWDAGNGLQDLGTLGGANGGAGHINDLGQVVGASTPVGTFPQHAFLWDAQNGVQDLGTLPGTNVSYAAAINAVGQVVGASFLQVMYYGYPPHAFLWDAQQGMQDLGTLPGASGSEARGINASGAVVGGSGGHAFLYGNGSMTDLNDLLPPNSGWTLTAATAINDAGQIVGYGDIGGHTHAFLLDLAGQVQPGPLAASTGLEPIQVAGTLEAPSLVLGPVSGVTARVEQGGSGIPDVTPVSQAGVMAPPALGQVLATSPTGRQGASTVDGRWAVWGDAVVELLTLDLPSLG